VIVELDEAVLHTVDEGLALEDIGIAALRRKTRGLTEGRTEVANRIPLVDASSLFLHLVEHVVLVLDVRAVEHHQDGQQSLIRPRAHERVLLPRPAAGTLERFLAQAKSTTWLHVGALLVSDRENRQKVDGRLMVADRGQHARERHFDRPFGPLIVVWRLLDVPFPAQRILNCQARIGSLLLSLHERVGRVRVRRPFAAPRSTKQIAARDVVGFLPELRHGHLAWRRSRLDLWCAERVVQGN
jgi:hypothetical protein